VDLIDAILSTCAVRRFRPEPLDDEDVRTCLRAAVQAPSGGNIQPWQFVVVTDADTRRAIGAVYRRAYDRYEPAMAAIRPPARSSDEEVAFERMRRSARYLAEHLGEAPVLVLVCMPAISMTLTDAEGPLDVGTPYASVYPAVQNLMLAARALGIGTTLTTVYRIYQEEVRRLCAVPDRYEIVALVPMGRPVHGPTAFRPRPRRPADTVTHWNRWGARTR